MHSSNTLLKVTPRPYFKTKALPSSATLINSFLSPSKGVDLMKGELYAGCLYGHTESWTLSPIQISITNSWLYSIGKQR